jgi:molybdopterin/thiamine biosynthesis adenylyltransferase
VVCQWLTLLISYIDEKNITALAQSADVILDCTDNFATLLLINKTCFELYKTLISVAAIRAQGQFMVFDFAKGPQCPCYNCLFPQTAEEPALNCQNSGVFGPVLGIIGSMQALKTMENDVLFYLYFILSIFACNESNHMY